MLRDHLNGIVLIPNQRSEEGEEEEENVIATASEYVFVTKGGKIASITDLSIGIGLQLFENE